MISRDVRCESESNVSDTKETTSSLKLNLEEKPDSDESLNASDEGKGLARKKERGLRPETAPAVNIAHKADEEEAGRLDYVGKVSFNIVN